MKLPELSEKTAAFLPDFCAIRVLLPLLLFAEVLAILLTLAANPVNASSLWEGLGLRLLFVSWVVLLSASLICMLKPVFNRLQQWQVGGLALIVVQLVILATSFISLQLAADQVGMASMFYWRNLGIGSLVTLSVLRYLYLQHQSQLQQQARSNAQFAALQARIRPHFLFNSLNTVTSLIAIDPPRAEALLEDLADLFRACLRDEGLGSDLGREIGLVRQYLNIEQTRLGARLQLVWQLSPELPVSLKMPGLLLQPIVENAVYHGIERIARGGEIRIQGRVYRRKLILTVTNPMPQNRVHKTGGNQMALENIRRRLLHAFGEAGRLLVSTSDGRFQVSIIIPVGSDA